MTIPSTCITLACTLCLLIPAVVHAQTGDLKLLDWRPISQMVVKETQVDTPKFPVIDIHNHLGGALEPFSEERTREYLVAMDEAGVAACISLDGGSRDDFYKEHLRVSQEVGGDRMIVFFRPDLSGIGTPGFPASEVAKLRDAVSRGARGLKIAKNLGLTLKDAAGKLVAVDDPRLDPIWAECATLNIPVMIHVTDPKAFFTPVDRNNERYDELGAHPNWAFYGPQFPAKEEILEARNRVFARHPDTIFIGAHVGTLPEELAVVGEWLAAYPNFHVDICARISELGRQPRTARKFFIEWQDRIVFGTDTPCVPEAYRIYYRFMETDDEYIDPTGGHHLQGRWMIYGVYLPDDVLAKVYYQNAEKLLGIDVDDLM
jgi:uncharacterized protein